MDILIRVDEETGEARTVVDGVAVCSHGGLAEALRCLLDRVETPGPSGQREIVRGIARREAERGMREAAEAARERSPAEYVVQLVTRAWERGNGDGEAKATSEAPGFDYIAALVARANELAAQYPERVTRERRRDLGGPSSASHEAPYSFAALERPITNGAVVALNGRHGQLSLWSVCGLENLISRLSREDA